MTLQDSPLVWVLPLPLFQHPPSVLWEAGMRECETLNTEGVVTQGNMLSLGIPARGHFLRGLQITVRLWFQVCAWILVWIQHLHNLTLLVSSWQLLEVEVMTVIAKTLWAMRSLRLKV